MRLSAPIESRRRFLQFLAVAPFALRESVIEEITKPRIFYSIPKNLRIGSRIDTLDLRYWGAVQAIELETWAKEIPTLFWSERPLYSFLKGSDYPMKFSSPREFKVPLRLTLCSS